ncbi:MAG: guanylate kinase [Burkholderiales bacterium]
MTTGDLYIVTAPSGAGKTSLVRALLAEDSQVRLSISHTTRPPRPGEVNGKDYHFVSEQRFLHMLEQGEFVENAMVYGNRYGTSRPGLTQAMQGGVDVLLEIDWQGARQVRSIFPGAVGIFILPPSVETLMQRLRSRAQDSEEVIARRVAQAKSDIGHVHEADYVIINSDFAEALRDFHAIVCAQRLKAQRQLERHAALINNMR